MKRKVLSTHPRVAQFYFAALIVAICFSGSPLHAREADVYKSLDVMCDVITIIQRDYIEKVSSGKLMRGALRGMLRSLDGYSHYMPAGGEAKGTGQEPEQEVLGTYGLEVAYKDNVPTVIAPVEGGPAWKAGMKPGDKIIKINEEAVGQRRLAELLQRFHGGGREKIELKVVRRGEHDFLDFTLEPGRIELPQTRGEMLEEKIGMLRITRFDKETVSRVLESVKSLQKQGAESLILDLRNCPGGEIGAAVEIADYFLPPGALVASLQGRAQGVNKELRTKGEELPHVGGPLVVLVNEGTSGAAEVLAGALRYSGEGILMGSDTFGCAYDEGSFTLSDGSIVRLVTGVYLTPAGKIIQDNGLSVDIPIERPPVTVKEEGGEEEPEGEGKPEEGEKDPVVQSAVDLIKGIRIIESAVRG